MNLQCRVSSLGIFYILQSGNQCADVQSLGCVDVITCIFSLVDCLMWLLIFENSKLKQFFMYIQLLFQNFYLY